MEGKTFFHEQVLLFKKRLEKKNYLCEKAMTAKRYMEIHYDEAISLDDLRREACLSKFHFIRLFRSYYGRTPYQFLTEVRVARAKELIAKGLALRDVCYAVGFTSVTSFTALFSKLTGTTPGRFQKVKMPNKSNFR